MINQEAIKEVLNVGAMEVNNMAFNENYIEIFLDICHISEELQEEINKAIEIQKVSYISDWNEWYVRNPELEKKWDFAWSSKPVVVDFNYLRVVLEAGKPIQYSVETGFHDSIYDYMETCASTIVDLSEYEEELKKTVVKVMIDRFF